MLACGRLCVLLGAVLLVVDARPGVEYNQVEEVRTKPEKLPPQGVVKTPNEIHPHAVLIGNTCGGTIISPKWILTAAHCSISMRRKYVVAGSGRYRVKRLIIHPLFSVGPYWVDAIEFHIKQVGARWDFMLAELEQPLPLDGTMMAAATLADHDLPAGTEVAFGGYGAARYGEYMQSDMHSMELLLQEDETCQTLEQYDKTDMLCAKGRPPRYDASCNGDSGSGLVDNNGQLVGVLSWGEDDAIDCRNGALVVFARVSSARDWIRQITEV